MRLQQKSRKDKWQDFSAYKNDTALLDELANYLAIAPLSNAVHLGLKGDEICIESRILTIADIFEALTASDRPYKEAKSLSQSIAILDNMRKAKHIDNDLFDLFLSSGVDLDYADINQYLSS